MSLEVSIGRDLNAMRPLKCVDTEHCSRRRFLGDRHANRSIVSQFDGLNSYSASDSGFIVMPYPGAVGGR